jgi:LacI family transcriptional regulator
MFMFDHERFNKVHRRSPVMPRRAAGPTVRDIAHKAKVSVGTVSRVLNRANDVDARLRSHVETVARRLGYELSTRTRKVVHTQPRTVALVLCEDSSINSAQAQLLLGAEGYLSSAGYSLLFARHGNGADIPAALQTPGLASCIILTGSIQRAFLESLERHGLRYVLLQNHFVDSGSAHLPVSFDDADGAAQATRYLAELGHRDIWFISDAARSWHTNRLHGYLHAVRQRGLEPHVHTIALADDEFENGRAALTHILDRQWPMTAVLAGSDQIAFGVREGLRQHRREIPRDVSLVGFEYGGDTAHSSNITSVLIDMMQAGARLAQAAVSTLEGASPYNIVIPATLVKRSTCRPVRKEEQMVL